MKAVVREDNVDWEINLENYVSVQFYPGKDGELTTCSVHESDPPQITTVERHTSGKVDELINAITKAVRHGEWEIDSIEGGVLTYRPSNIILRPKHMEEDND